MTVTLCFFLIAKGEMWLASKEDPITDRHTLGLAEMKDLRPAPLVAVACLGPMAGRCR